MIVAALHFVVTWPNQDMLSRHLARALARLEVWERVAAVPRTSGLPQIDEPKALRLFTSSPERFWLLLRRVQGVSLGGCFLGRLALGLLTHLHSLPSGPLYLEEVDRGDQVDQFGVAPVAGVEGRRLLGDMRADASEVGPAVVV